MGREGGGKDLIIPSLSPSAKVWVGGFLFIFIFQASTFNSPQECRQDNSLQKLQMEKKPGREIFLGEGGVEEVGIEGED